MNVSKSFWTDRIVVAKWEYYYLLVLVCVHTVCQLHTFTAWLLKRA